MLRRPLMSALARTRTPNLFGSGLVGKRLLASASVTRSSRNDPARKQQDKLLFTPGPLTTSYATKEAMLRDLGSRDSAFIQVIKDVCSGLLQVAGVSADAYTTIPVQGSGTFGVESVLSSVVARNKRILIIANGSYGTRMVQIAKAHGIGHEVLETPDDTPPNLAAIEAALKADKDISHVAAVHSETTSGIVNDVEAIGAIVAKYGRSYIVDAMSSFGAVPLDFKKGQIDYLVSSSNKCIEGVPGFSYIIARKQALKDSEGHARTVSLNLHAQRAGLDKDGQFRFTPPTHALISFRQALVEHKAEGGVPARSARYKANQRALFKGMKDLGFELYLKPEQQGYIISSYRYPTDKNWNFTTFYSKLNDLNFVIYPGKVSKADCFRIGHIGRLFPEDTADLLKAIDKVCKEMKTAKYFSN